MSVSKGSNKSKFTFSEIIDNTLKPEFNPKESEVIKTTTKKEESPRNASEGVKSGNNPVGRPYKGEVKRITLSIPIEYFKKVQAGAILGYQGNITAYINSLIKRDIETNQVKYTSVVELMK